MSQYSENECLVCLSDLSSPTLHGSAYQFSCTNCGQHLFDHLLVSDLHKLPREWAPRAAVAHMVFKASPKRLITQEDFWRWAKEAKLASASEQLESLILFLGDHFRPGQVEALRAANLPAKVGALNADEAVWVVRQAVAMGLLAGTEPASYSPGAWELKGAALTLKGWEYHREALRSGARSTHAFMAMSFHDPEADAMFRDHMQAAAKEVGFELRRADHDAQLPGLIDDSMRVDIRTSRFVVCDLTGGNLGAYWEAGFAEGIGRKVIYTCREADMRSRDPIRQPHFDTAHQFTIPWDTSNPGELRRRLKNAIRAAFPDDALMTDGSRVRGAGNA